MNSDRINRDNTKFTIGALEQSVFENSLEGVPSLINHDFHRPIGWNKPLGLYFEPNLTRTVGNFFVVDNEDDSDLLLNKINNYLNQRNYLDCKDFIQEFKELLGINFSEEGSFLYSGCVGYKKSGILFQIYPFLKGIQDKDGLIYLDSLLESFEYIGSGIFKNKIDQFCIYSHQYFRRSLSYHNNYNSYFIDNFVSIDKKDIRLRIAVDENVIGLTKTFSNSVELEYWWGPKFSNDISKIPNGVTRYECNEYEKSFSGISGTEFWWKSEKDEKTLEIEEIKEIPSSGLGQEIYGCRYIHSIYNIRNKEFFHFDGAIRLYNEDSIIKRWEKSINKAGKDTVYTKLFRIDGKLNISDWKRLCIYYYSGNPLLYEYFDKKNEFQNLLSQPKSEIPKISELVPYKIKKEDGLKIFVSYHPPSNLNVKERLIINPEIKKFQNGENIQVVEYEILEIKKAIVRLGGSLEIPEKILFTKSYDFYSNYATILHSSENTPEFLQQTLKAYKLIFKKIKEWRNDTVSFTLAWPFQDKECRLSIFGKISEILKWLEINKEIPLSREKFRKWLDLQNKWLSKNYKNGSNSENCDLLKSDGVQYIKRQAIDNRWIQNIEEKEEGFYYELKLPKTKNEILSLLKNEKLFTSHSILLDKITCSETNQSYIDSPKSKLIDENVTMIIEECRLMNFFWNDEQYS